MNPLEQYQSDLNKSKRNAILMTGIGAAYNAKLIRDTKNAPSPERLSTPILSAPYINSPGPEIVNNRNQQEMSRGANASRDLVRSMGRPDLAVAINSNEDNTLYDAMTKGLLSEYDTIQKNQLAATETDNANIKIAHDVKAKNIADIRAENLEDSNTISEGINQIYSMGTNLFSILGKADSLNFSAQKMYKNELAANAKQLAGGSEDDGYN